MKVYVVMVAREDGKCLPIAYTKAYKHLLDAMVYTSLTEGIDLDWQETDLEDEWFAKAEGEIYVINAIEIEG